MCHLSVSMTASIDLVFTTFQRPMFPFFRSPRTFQFPLCALVSYSFDLVRRPCRLGETCNR